MLFFSIIISLVLVYIIESRLFSKHSFDNLEYRSTLSAQEVFQDEDVFLYEEITNNKNLPLPNVKVSSELPQGLYFRLSNKNISSGNFNRDLLQSYIQSIFVLGGHRQIQRRWRVYCKKRGVYTIGSAMLIANDLLGLNAVSKRYDGKPCKFNTVTVLPKPINLDEHYSSSSLHSGEIISRHSILSDPLLIAGTRDYTTFDPMNKINWKSTAAHGRIMVNIEEYTQLNLFNIVINMNSRDIEKSPSPSLPELIESCITVCASLLDKISGSNIPVRLISNSVIKDIPDIETIDISDEIEENREVQKDMAITSRTISFSKPYQGRSDMIQALRLLAAMPLEISCPAERMIDHILARPEIYSSGSNIIFVSAYLSRRMIICAQMLEKRGIHTVFYITSTFQNAEFLPEDISGGDIEIYFRNANSFASDKSHYGL